MTSKEKAERFDALFEAIIRMAESENPFIKALGEIIIKECGLEEIYADL